MDANILVQSLERAYLSNPFLICFISSFVEISPFGWMFPGGSILSIGGFFSYGSFETLISTIAGGTLGSITTFSLAYLIGKNSGSFLIKKLKAGKSAKKASELLEIQGPAILTTSLLSSAIRFWTAYIAGAKKYNFKKFLFYASIASFSWSTFMTTIGIVVGSERENFGKIIKTAGALGYLLIIITSITLYFIIKYALKQKSTLLK